MLSCLIALLFAPSAAHNPERCNISLVLPLAVKNLQGYPLTEYQKYFQLGIKGSMVWLQSWSLLLLEDFVAISAQNEKTWAFTGRDHCPKALRRMKGPKEGFMWLKALTSVLSYLCWSNRITNSPSKCAYFSIPVSFRQMYFTPGISLSVFW